MSGEPWERRGSDGGRAVIDERAMEHACGHVAWVTTDPVGI